MSPGIAFYQPALEPFATFYEHIVQQASTILETPQKRDLITTAGGRTGVLVYGESAYQPGSTFFTPSANAIAKPSESTSQMANDVDSMLKGLITSAQ